MTGQNTGALSQIRLDLPEGAKRIIDTLEKSGFEAYAVGGCVRDSLLGRIPEDWDITTSALPEQVKRLFRRTVETGIKHGTVTVMDRKTGYEVTTYRIDGEYEDGRHPNSVSFTGNLEEDLKRRDFTVNAMAYNPGQGLVDLFDGLEDLRKGVIRCVGDPSERFGEDALRILRAVRFSAQLEFDIERHTRSSMQSLASTLQKISQERIQAELEKLLRSGHPGKLREAYEAGITAIVLPELDEMMNTPYGEPDFGISLGEHSIRTVEQIGNERSLRWAALLHEIGENRTRDVLKRLKFDNHTIDTVYRLISYRKEMPDCTMASVRRSICRVGAEYYPLLLQLKQAGLAADQQISVTESEENAQLHERDGRMLSLQEESRRLAYVSDAYKAIMERGDCVSLKELAVTGRDLMALGIPQGKQLGEILAVLLEQVLEDPHKNERELLLRNAKELIK